MSLFAFAFTGQIALGSLVTLLTSIVGFATVYVQSKQNKAHISDVKEKVEQINQAVNGVGPDQPPMVQNVQEIHDQVVSNSEEHKA